MEVFFGEGIKAVCFLGGKEVVGDHGVEEGSLDLYVLVVEYGEVVFEGVSNFYDLLIGKEGLEELAVFFLVAGFLGEGEVKGFVGLGAEGDAEEVGVLGLQGGGFCIKAKGFCFLEVFYEFLPFARGF